MAATTEIARGKVFNLGGDRVINLHELANLLIEINGGGSFSVHSFPSDRKRIDIGDYYADDSLIRKELGWQSPVSLREGLASTLNFYRNNLEHYL